LGGGLLTKEREHLPLNLKKRRPDRKKKKHFQPEAREEKTSRIAGGKETAGKGKSGAEGTCNSREAQKGGKREKSLPIRGSLIGGGKINAFPKNDQTPFTEKGNKKVRLELKRALGKKKRRPEFSRVPRVSSQ